MHSFKAVGLGWQRGAQSSSCAQRAECLTRHRTRGTESPGRVAFPGAGPAGLCNGQPSTLWKACTGAGSSGHTDRLHTAPPHCLASSCSLCLYCLAACAYPAWFSPEPQETQGEPALCAFMPVAHVWFRFWPRHTVMCQCSISTNALIHPFTF